MNRRTFLATTGVGLATPLVGCLGGSSDPRSGGQTRTTDGTETTTERGSDGPTELVESDAIQYGPTSTRPNWFEESGETVGNVVVIDSEERADVIWPHDEVPTERRRAVADFLGETNFQESVLLYVESVGPNACYAEVEVRDVAFADGELTATAAAALVDGGSDGSDDGNDSDGTDDGMTACAEIITFPSALVRATFSGEPATQATVTLTDGWGNEETVTATADDSLSPDASDLDGYVRPEGDPATVPNGLACDDAGVERVQSWVDDANVEWGAATADDGTETLALRVDQREVALGDTVEVTMTNVTDEGQYTGNRYKYAFEVLTDDGWQDVRVVPEDERLEYTDEAIVHAPGEGFQWSFDLTEDGLFEGHFHEGVLDVCPDLQPGRYRFVFWEPAVAVAFDVTE
jgi:hypothetical protein